MRTIDFRPLADEHYTITTDTPERLEGEMVLGKAAGGPPIHVHPEQTEYLDLLDGRLAIYSAGSWKTVEAPYHWEVPAGEPHTFKADAAVGARVRFCVAPGYRFIKFLEDTERLVRSGKLTSYETLSGLMYSSMLVKRYSREFRAAQPATRFIMALAALMGPLTGKRI